MSLETMGDELSSPCFVITPPVAPHNSNTLFDVAWTSTGYKGQGDPVTTDRLDFEGTVHVQASKGQEKYRRSVLFASSSPSLEELLLGSEVKLLYNALECVRQGPTSRSTIGGGAGL